MSPHSGPARAGVGRGIDYDNGVFTLEGYGPVPPHALLDYDRRGQIEWAYAGLRECGRFMRGLRRRRRSGGRLGDRRFAGGRSAGRDNPVRGARRDATVAAAGLGHRPDRAGRARRHSRRRRDRGRHRHTGFPAPRDLAREASVKAGVYSIEFGVQAWANDHGGLYPDASQVTSQGLSIFVARWPANPYQGASVPMTPGTGPGQYLYVRAVDGRSFRLVGFGLNHQPVVAVPVSQGTTAAVTHLARTGRPHRSANPGGERAFRAACVAATVSGPNCTALGTCATKSTV